MRLTTSWLAEYYRIGDEVHLQFRHGQHVSAGLRQQLGIGVAQLVESDRWVDLGLFAGGLHQSGLVILEPWASILAGEYMVQPCLPAILCLKIQPFVV